MYVRAASTSRNVLTPVLAAHANRQEMHNRFIQFCKDQIDSANKRPIARGFLSRQAIPVNGGLKGRGCKVPSNATCRPQPACELRHSVFECDRLGPCRINSRTRSGGVSSGARLLQARKTMSFRLPRPREATFVLLTFCRSGRLLLPTLSGIPAKSAADQHLLSRNLESCHI